MRECDFAMSAETSSRLPMIGERIAGKYRIERMIGRGGMGVVFAAEHEVLHQRVAVKFLVPERADDPVLTTRLLNEARAAASIRSEHVARVLDVEELAGSGAFIVLEYLEGMNLADVLDRRGQLPMREAVQYVAEALDALAHAHSMGIVHRDLKPSNLFLASRPDGTHAIKVLDFGVSKLKAEPHAEPTGLELTLPAALVGSPHYMAPEQVRDARTVDARADIWSIGVLLYKLLTGAMPFDAESLGGAFAAVLTEAPKSLCAIVMEVPADLERVVFRCLAKSRDDRYADVGELAQALAPFGADARLVERVMRTVAAGRGTKSPLALEALVRAPSSGPRPRSAPTLDESERSPAPRTPSGGTGTLASGPSRPQVSDGSFGRAPTMLSGEPPRPERSRAPWLALGLVTGVMAGAGAIALFRAPAAPPIAPTADTANALPLPEDMEQRPRPFAPLEGPGSSAPRAIAPGGAPRSCADVRAMKNATEDGEYRIDPDGAGPIRPFDVHCRGMGDPARAPREYLTLVHGTATREPAANATTYVWGKGPCACPDLTRVFTKVRLDPADLSIDATDAAFASYARPLDCEMRDQNHCGARIDVTYGGAGSCSARGDASGKASIDLRGTPFALAADARFVPSGFAAAGSATIAPDRKTAQITGGGMCGAMASATAPKIALVQDR
jgi:serine/threonine-protein kinase